VPLPDHGRGIAPRPQYLGEEGLAGGNPDLGLEEFVPAEPLLVAAGEQAHPRRCAHAAGSVGLGAPHPLRREAVDVGCAEGRVGAGRILRLAAEVAPAEVVGQDHDHVGPRPARGRVGRGGTSRSNDDQDQRGKEAWRH
jgi:hypothetical protein